MREIKLYPALQILHIFSVGTGFGFYTEFTPLYDLIGNCQTEFLREMQLPCHDF